MSKRSKTFDTGSSLSATTRPEDTYGQIIQSPRQAAVAAAEQEQQEQARKDAAASGSRSTGSAPSEMTLEEIQAVPKAERRPTNFALPHALELHRRMTYYKADHDVQIQDQIAVATDRWLREQGY